MRGGSWRPSASQSPACRRKRGGARTVVVHGGRGRVVLLQVYGVRRPPPPPPPASPTGKTRELLVFPRRLINEAGRERHLAV